MIKNFQPWLKFLGVNEAVFYSLMAKIWGLASVPVSLVFITVFLSAEVQGYYYTFLSLLALQTFLELSFSSILINFSSHEWSHLHLDESGRIVGKEDAMARLSHLVRFGTRWYLTIAMLFSLLVGIGGYIFLAQKSDPHIFWKGPWCLVVVLAGVQLFLLPFQSVLEGCNQIASMAQIRMRASMIGALGFWAGLISGFHLWSVSIMFALNCLTQIFLLRRKYSPFFRDLFEMRSTIQVHYWEEIFPVQWRLALGGVVNYFSTAIFTPIMFWYHGAKVAGQMGMGWQIMGAAQTIALTWIQTSIPAFGEKIAQKKYEELDRLFFRITFISFFILIFLCLAAWGIVKAFQSWGGTLSERFMAPLPLSLFLLTALFYHFPQCQSVYLRAHRKEPLLMISLISSLAIGFAVWFFGRAYGMVGAGGAYLGVVALFIFPSVFYVWENSRKKWHQEI